MKSNAKRVVERYQSGQYVDPDYLKECLLEVANEGDWGVTGMARRVSDDEMGATPASGVQALAQTASESATGDVLLPATFDDVDGLKDAAIQQLIASRQEVERLTRDLAAARAKIESALAMLGKAEGLLVEIGFHVQDEGKSGAAFISEQALSVADDIRKLLEDATDTSTPQSRARTVRG